MPEENGKQSRGKKVEFVALAVILLTSVALNLWNNGFPLGYHGDEPKKVRFVQTGTQDFNHPILMLQVARVANLAMRFAEPQQVVELGRACSALAGTITVLLAYWLAREVLTSRWALLSAAAVAMSPILVIHAHYFKEDTIFTTCVLLSLGALTRFVRRSALETTIMLGVATGLAMASHYKSLLLIALYLLCPFILTRSINMRQYYARLTQSLLLAGWIFLSINWPLVESPQVFAQGVNLEAVHAISGHTTRIGPTDYWFGFHLWYSLVPGITLAIVALGGWQILWAVWHWKETSWEERLFVVFVAIFYGVPELSPLKPDPDFARYVIPVVPVLIILSVRGVNTLPLIGPREWMRWAVYAAALGYCLVDTLLLDYFMTRDTRRDAASWIADTGSRALREQYTDVDRDLWTLTELDVNEAQRSGVRYLVASSFMYDRYFRGSTLQGQDTHVYEGCQRYRDLFKHPYREFAPSYKSFAFSNPTIRIIDIDEKARADGASP